MESDTSDDNKRKREQKEGNEADIFKKSKKLIRTPSKSGIKDEQKEKMDELMKGVREIKQNQTKYQEEQRKIIQENERLKEENKEVKREIKNMKEIIERLEKENVRNNVIVSGLKIETENREDMKKGMINFIKQNIGIEIMIKDVYKMGPKLCKIVLGNYKKKTTNYGK